MSLPIVIVRPEPDASRTAALAGALRLSALKIPLFETVAVAWDAGNIQRFDALMMTSANAARLGGKGLASLRHLPLYSVGKSTEKAARELGFLDITTGERDAATMSALIHQDGRRRVLHLAGRDRVAFEAKFALETLTVYEANELPPPALPDAGVVLLHSPRAATRFAKLCNNRDRYAVVAISANVAAAAGEGWLAVAIAAEPTDAAMLGEAATQLAVPNLN